MAARFPSHAPEREGFGGRVIKTVPVREKNGDVKVDYPPDGLYCRMEFVETGSGSLFLSSPACGEVDKIS